MRFYPLLLPLYLHAAAELPIASSSSSMGTELQEITIAGHVLDEEAISRAIIQHYFNAQESPSRTIEISLRKQLRALSDSDTDKDRFAIVQEIAMKKPEKKHTKILNELLVQTLTDAMAHTEHRINNRWTKKQSAYMAAGTTVITCILTSIVVLIINYV